MVIIKKYKVQKHSSTNFRKDWNKFPEIFLGKYSEISELTTLYLVGVVIGCGAAEAGEDADRCRTTNAVDDAGHRVYGAVAAW